MTNCPNCGASYALKDIRYFGQLGMTAFVQLTCHNCHASSLAGIPANVLVPEEKRETLNQFQSRVTYDDAIEIHRILQDRNLNFKDFFERS